MSEPKLIRFKTPVAEREFFDSPTQLRTIATFFARYAWYFFGALTTITRVRETVEKESGVHLAGRALDIRDEYSNQDTSYRTFTDSQADELVRVVRARFPRDDSYHVILHHAVTDSLRHFHVQIPHTWLTTEERKRFS